MDGVQRNFSMMAEKIDRMRCLRERCDDYVRLIKLTLDESIQEQNSLLVGSAIHNRLKCLGLTDCCSKPAAAAAVPPSGQTYKIDRPLQLQFHRGPTTNEFDFAGGKSYECSRVFDDFDDRSGFGPRRDARPDPSVFDDTPRRILSADCRPIPKPSPPYVRQFGSAIYDGKNAYRAPPIDSHRKHGEIVNFRPPQEYRVCYFPTSKPIAQYPRLAAGRFYRRRPVKQYPQEEVPHWRSPCRPMVRVVERDPFYLLNDYDVDPHLVPECSGRRWSKSFPTDDDTPRYRGYDFDNPRYRGAADLGGLRSSFAGATRPCSPVLQLPRYDGGSLLDSSDCSLLEKKIRDYVVCRSPREERFAEKYAAPYYESRPPYRYDFDPTPRSKMYPGDDESFRKSARWSEENALKRNSVANSPEKKSVDRRKPVWTAKRRSFDRGIRAV